ncbi:MAG: hypothetical protein ACK5LV_08530 [Lachnospirales bacterium]
MINFRNKTINMSYALKTTILIIVMLYILFTGFLYIFAGVTPTFRELVSMVSLVCITLIVTLNF